MAAAERLPPDMSADPFSVVIAGGGVAGIEGALALREMAGDRVSITIIEPRDELVYRPMTVQEPFAYRADERQAGVRFECRDRDHAAHPGRRAARDLRPRRQPGRVRTARGERHRSDHTRPE